jgi:hypothetical protein
VRSNIPDDIPIIAVYLRVTDTPHGLEFNVAECAIDDGREGCRACTLRGGDLAPAAAVAESGWVSYRSWRPTD